ncbi:unnamed protein product [Pylaiella littoralis]
MTRSCSRKDSIKLVQQVSGAVTVRTQERRSSYYLLRRERRLLPGVAIGSSRVGKTTRRHTRTHTGRGCGRFFCLWLLYGQRHRSMHTLCMYSNFAEFWNPAKKSTQNVTTQGSQTSRKGLGAETTAGRWWLRRYRDTNVVI